MALGFVTGRLGSKREDYLFDLCFKEAKEKDTKPIYILVPEKYTYEIEKKLSEYLEKKENIDPNFRIMVVSFSTLSKIVFTNVGGLKQRKLIKSSKNMIIFKAIEKSLKNLTFFKTSEYKDGFINEIIDIISDFKRNGFSKDDLLEIRDNIKQEALRLKFSDFIKIFDCYENLIENKYMDTEDVFEIFKEKIENFDQIKGCSVFVLGYMDFTLSQLNIVEKLIKYSKNIYFSLLTDLKNLNSKMNIFNKVNNTYITLKSLAIKNNVEILENKILSNEDYYDEKSLLHLEKNILEISPLKFEKDFSNIKALACKNNFQEVEFVANEIIKLIKTKNLRYNEITVCTRDLQDYDYIIKRIFEDYKINYFLDEKISASTNPIVILILSILEMKINNYSYISVFKYLKTNLTGISSDEIFILENYCLANGINYKAFFDEKWKKISHKVVDEKEIDEELKKINEIKDKFILPIKSLHEKLKGKNTVKEICTYLYEFTLDISLDKRIDDYIENFKLSNNLYKAKEYSLIFSSFVSILEEMVEFMGNEQISLKNFLNLFSSQFKDLKLGIVPPCKDEVFVTSVDRMQKENQKIVFLIGFNDDKFPKNISNNSLISEDEKEKLIENGMKFTTDNFSKIIDEQFYIYKALCFAKERLYITFPLSTLLLENKRPSNVLKKLKNIFNGFKIQTLKDESYKIKDIYLAFSKEKLYKIYIESLKNLDENLNCDEKNTLFEIENFLKEDKEYKDKITLLSSFINYKNEIDNIKEYTSKLYDSDYFSVSKLEKFACCPFSYFLNYGLNLKKREIYTFTPIDYGVYCHKVLDSFFKDIVKNSIDFKTIDFSYISNEVNDITNSILNENYILSTSKQYKHFSSILNRNLKSSISVMIQSLKQGNFIPYAFEEAFFENSSISPINIKLDNKNVKLIGKIDRYDILKKKDINYLKVIDYKSSKKDIDLNMIYNGIGTQLFIYMNALISKDKEKFKPAALLYDDFSFNKVKFDTFKEFSNLDENLFNEKIIDNNKPLGFVIKDLDLIENLDTTLGNDKQKSLILPITLKNKGLEISNRTKGLSEDEFEIVNKFILKNTKKILKSIYSGDISLKPYKYDENTACKYCEYKSICKFDEKCNKYKIIKKIAKNNNLEDILEKMNKDLNEKEGYEK